MDGILAYSGYIFRHLNEEHFFAKSQYFCQA